MTEFDDCLSNENLRTVYDCPIDGCLIDDRFIKGLFYWWTPDEHLTTAWWPPEDWLITDQQLQDDLSDTNYDFLKLKRLQDDKNYRLMSLPTSTHSLKTDIVQRQRKFVSSLPEHLYTTGIGLSG